MLIKLIDVAAQTYELTLGDFDAVDIRQSFKPEYVGTTMYLDAKHNTSTGVPLVFEILTVESDKSMTGRWVTLDAFIRSCVDQNKQQASVLNVYHEALKIVNEAMGDPFKGDNTKTILDVANYAATMLPRKISKPEGLYALRGNGKPVKKGKRLQ